MNQAAIAALLGVAVLATWLGCLGFARLREPLDRLHCVAFVNAGAGIPLTLAGFLADGASSRALKLLCITAFSLLAGAALSHATGRALLTRAAASDPDQPEAAGP